LKPWKRNPAEHGKNLTYSADHKTQFAFFFMNTVRVAENLQEACQLVEAGFEYVTEMDGVKIFRKRK